MKSYQLFQQTRLWLGISVMVFLGLQRPALAETLVSSDKPLREVVIQVDGMFCPFCTFGVEKQLKKLSETSQVQIVLATGEAIVMLHPDAKYVESRFDKAIKQAGFTHSGIALRKRKDGLASALSLAIGTLPEKSISHRPNPNGFKYQRTIGEPGKALGQFNQPMDISFAREGWFVVAEAGNARIQQFHADGTPWRQWSISGDGRTSLTHPTGVAVGPEGDIWVSDYEADTISRYGADGTPQAQFGTWGREPGKFDSPTGLTFTAQGLLAIADFYNQRIQLFKPDGKWVRDLEGLNYPTRVTAAPNGLLWVADAYGYRVVAFDAKGNQVRVLGKKGHGPGEFDVSAGIALLPDNRLAVVDFMNHRIQTGTTDGTFISDLGTQGVEPGEFERPIDVALAPTGSLYVVDWGNNRIQVFTVSEMKR